MIYVTRDTPSEDNTVKWEHVMSMTGKIQSLNIVSDNDNKFSSEKTSLKFDKCNALQYKASKCVGGSDLMPCSFNFASSYTL